LFGGRTSTTSPTPMADNTKLYAFGVGRSTAVNGVWRTLSPNISASGAPPAREGAAMTSRWRATKADNRPYFVFGGEDAAGSPVAPDLWRLKRHDLTVSADTNQYVWGKFVSTPGGPSGRTRPGLGYVVDTGPLVLVGGDTNGEAQSGGLTRQIWTASL